MGPGLVINVDTVRRGQLVDIHYCSPLNEAGAAETPTTPGQPHTHTEANAHTGTVYLGITIILDNSAAHDLHPGLTLLVRPSHIVTLTTIFY